MLWMILGYMNLWLFLIMAAVPGYVILHHSDDFLSVSVNTCTLVVLSACSCFSQMFHHTIFIPVVYVVFVLSLLCYWFGTGTVQ